MNARGVWRSEVCCRPTSWCGGFLSPILSGGLPEFWPLLLEHRLPLKRALVKAGLIRGAGQSVRFTAKRTSSAFKLGGFIYEPSDVRFYKQRIDYSNHFTGRFSRLVDQLPPADERRVLLTVDADRRALTPEEAARRDFHAAEAARLVIEDEPELAEDINKALRLQAEWALIPRWSRRLKLKERLRLLAVTPQDAVTDSAELSPQLREPFSHLSYEDQQARETEILKAARVLREELTTDLVASSRGRAALLPAHMRRPGAL